jgi:hypothetical protein
MREIGGERVNTVGDPVLQKINVSVILSFQRKIPRCKQVLYDYVGLYKCQRVKNIHGIN